MILQFYDLPHQTSLTLGSINFILKYMEHFSSYLSQYKAFPLQRPISYVLGKIVTAYCIILNI